MAFTCGFYNGVNNDRTYNTEQMSAIFDGIIKDGVFDSIGKIFSVGAGEGMKVIVNPGRAWFNHTWSQNDSPFPLAITQADPTLSRIDAVVLEVNATDAVRDNCIKIIKGTPASSPTKPALVKSEKINQHPLAYVKLTPGATSVLPSMITNAVGTSECPFVTGILASVNIDVLFEQWRGDFTEWFDNLKEQMTGNVVANLQKQIDLRLKTEDKASSAEAKAGTNDTKYMTPLRVKEAAASAAFPTGDIKVSAINLENVKPGEYLTCDGRTITRAGYPNLFPLLKGRYGYGGKNVKAPTALFSGQYKGNHESLMATNDAETEICALYRKGAYSYGALVANIFSPDGTFIRSCEISGYNYPRYMFYIGNVPYLLTFDNSPNDSSSYRTRIYNLSGATATEIYSVNDATFEFLGGYRSGNTQYLAAYAIYSQYQVVVMSVTGNSVARTIVETGYQLESNQAGYVIGDLLVYWKNSADIKQTRLTAPSPSTVTNQVLKDVRTLRGSQPYNNGFYQVASKDGNKLMYVQSKWQESYKGPREVAILNYKNGTYSIEKIAADVSTLPVNDSRFFFMRASFLSDGSPILVFGAQYIESSGAYRKDLEYREVALTMLDGSLKPLSITGRYEPYMDHSLNEIHIMVNQYVGQAVGPYAAYVSREYTGTPNSSNLFNSYAKLAIFDLNAQKIPKILSRVAEYLSEVGLHYIKT